MTKRAGRGPSKGGVSASGWLGVWHYVCLEQVDLATDGQLAAALNRHGLANWTVCPLCFVDDFTHTASCLLLEQWDGEEQGEGEGEE